MRERNLIKNRKIHNIRKVVALLLGVCFIIYSFSGCGAFLEDTGISYIDATTDVSELSEATIDTIAKNVVAGMTLNEKAGQLFVVDLMSLEPSLKSVTSEKLSKKMKKRLNLYPVGGVILYSRDIKTVKQTKRLIANLQEKRLISMFVCVDEEGGEVSRIAGNRKMKMAAFPNMFEIGQTGDSKKALEVGTTIGQQIKELGFNVDFAPVADVLSERATGEIGVENEPTNEKAASFEVEDMENKEIGERSFGYDASLVSSMVEQEVKGLTKQGVCATLKHFPGQGSASMDTHVGAANVSKSIESLRSCDFLPFKAGIKAGAQFVMMSHESVNSVTGDTIPACMSSLLVTDILKDELGFDGIVITDAMNMKSITGQYSSEEAAVSCILAGVDMILMPADLEAAYNGIIEAVKDGTISEERIDESVFKIIKCKIRQNILKLTSDIVVYASQSSYEDYQNIGELER